MRPTQPPPAPEGDHDARAEPGYEAHALAGGLAGAPGFDVVGAVVAHDRLRRAAGVIAAVAALAVGFAAWRGSPPPPELSLPMAQPGTVPPASQPSDGEAGVPAQPGDAVVVHVSGAVARPGVYALPEEARVADLLDAAGGPRPTRTSTG